MSGMGTFARLRPNSLLFSGIHSQQTTLVVLTQRAPELGESTPRTMLNAYQGVVSAYRR
jgi:hypothetical protein